MPVDMHVHTCHSDGAPSVRRVLHHAQRNGFGFAITDHNEVSGVRELPGSEHGIPIIPGIEIDCAEGPHLLLYFYHARDLFDFYDRYLRSRRRGAQFMTTCPTADEVITAAEAYNCLKIAAHPFGYFLLDRGVLKCAAKNLLPGIIDRLDGIEVICGGMGAKLNRAAAAYAEQHPIAITGGSDAHILSGVGSVVTGAAAGSAEEFLDEVRKGRSIVHGLPGGVLSRGMTAGVIGLHYVPYAITVLQARTEPYSTRLRASIRRSRNGDRRQ